MITRNLTVGGIKVRLFNVPPNASEQEVEEFALRAIKICKEEDSDKDKKQKR